MIKFEYKNHRGVIEERTVEPESLDYMTNPGYGYPPGWFLTCKDYTRGRNGDIRSFYLDNIQRNVTESLNRTHRILLK